jgi:hypothetical protein
LAHSPEAQTQRPSNIGVMRNSLDYIKPGLSMEKTASSYR